MSNPPILAITTPVGTKNKPTSRVEPKWMKKHSLGSKNDEILSESHFCCKPILFRFAQGWKIKLVGLRLSDKHISQTKFDFEYFPADYYGECTKHDVNSSDKYVNVRNGMYAKCTKRTKADKTRNCRSMHLLRAQL